MRARGIVIGFAVVLMLAGCAAPGPENLAQGELQDATGETSGHVTIARLVDGSVTAVFTSVNAPDTGSLLLMTTDHAIDDGETCLEGGTTVPGPPYQPSTQDTYLLDPATTTPEHLAAYVIARETDAETGCLVEIVGYANLDWS